MRIMTGPESLETVIFYHESLTAEVEKGSRIPRFGKSGWTGAGPEITQHP
ncbi:hypothetical protein [Gemmobacter caeruleus]|nr:hypothetical protein [Gemmobacter caeruleus]